MQSIKTKLILFVASIFLIGLVSCSNDEEPVRMNDDILGIWSPSDVEYLEFSEDNIVHNLQIEYQDGESIGIMYEDVFYYEPGYNLVIYVTANHQINVYKIVDLTSSKFTWCWVKEIHVNSSSDITQLIGEIINEAQEGFKLDPSLYQDFVKVPEDEYLSILDTIDIIYPW